MAEEMRGRARESMKTIAAGLDSGVRAQLEEAARALVALRYYQRFIDEASRHEKALTAATMGGTGPADGSGSIMAEALFQIAEPGESRGKHACRTRAVGIDLGTTNSLVAIVDAGRPTALADEQGDAIVPSVVHYAGDGRRRRRRGRARSSGGRVPAGHHRVGQAFHGARPARRRGDAQADAVPVRRRCRRRSAHRTQHRTKASFASRSRGGGR